MGSLKFVICMRIFVFYLNANAIWLVNTQLMNYVDEEMEFMVKEAFVFRCVFNVTAIFSFMSYVTACVNKMKKLPRGGEPWCATCER